MMSRKFAIVAMAAAGISISTLAVEVQAQDTAKFAQLNKYCRSKIIPQRCSYQSARGQMMWICARNVYDEVARCVAKGGKID